MYILIALLFDLEYTCVVGKMEEENQNIDEQNEETNKDNVM